MASSLALMKSWISLSVTHRSNLRNTLLKANTDPVFICLIINTYQRMNVNEISFEHINQLSVRHGQLISAIINWKNGFAIDSS